MKSTKFLKTYSEDAIEPEKSFELLYDPMRSKIIFEIVLKGEVTAESLMEQTEKSRSTISHHLKKLVESGIIDVYMNPTGKTKYYRLTQDLQRLMYSLDKEKLASGTPEEQSDFIIDMGQMFSIINHTYANLYSDQLKLYQKYKPFDEITVNENEEITFTINNKKRIEMPYLTFFITGEEQAEFLREKFDKLLEEFRKEYKNFPDVESILNASSKHIVNIQILPYLNKDELE
ncbi:MAG TPA: winged helix-turn-helix domain-containing protein [Candidatus Bathyarchaeia archaeon]|nr:winged helix-turn-helix domain-containing protein [Candidatus Bathyarchaeia archaeon]